MKIMNLAAIAVMGLMLATAFSGCVGGFSAKGNDVNDGTGNETGNETSNETENETGNNTEPLSYNYTGTIKTLHEEWDATFEMSIDGLEEQESGEGHKFKMPEKAVKITITATSSSSIPTEGMYDTGIFLDNPKAKTIASVDETEQSVTLEFSNRAKLADAGEWEVRLKFGCLLFSLDPVVHAVMDVEYYE